ncbi:hypothetical protein Fmac_002874 [Flemingia macrophylla]|uniref:Uncharacterized protein n=1 Tax=Flemingia macrophylla TaxID=520843 RepID=A0ABD1NL70_9FABA
MEVPLQGLSFLGYFTVFLRYERNEIDFDALSRKYFIHTALFNLDLYKDAWQSVTETWYTPPVRGLVQGHSSMASWTSHALGLSKVPHEAPEEPGSNPLTRSPFSLHPPLAIAPTSSPLKLSRWTSLTNSRVTLMRMDLWPNQDMVSEAVHSPKAFKMIQSHLSVLLEDWHMGPLQTIVQISKIKPGKLYDASVMYGCFIKRVDEWFQHDRAMGTPSKKS